MKILIDMFCLSGLRDLGGIRLTTHSQYHEGLFLANAACRGWRRAFCMATQLSAITLVGPTGQLIRTVRFMPFYYACRWPIKFCAHGRAVFFHRAKVYRRMIS